MSVSPPKSLFNLQKTNILLADADAMGQGILGQMLMGFLGRKHKDTTASAAAELMQKAVTKVIADGKTLTGICKVRGDKLELRVPETCSCAKTGQIAVYQRVGK